MIHHPKRFHYHSMEVRRKYWYVGKKRQFWHWGYDWYHYLLQDAHDKKPIRKMKNGR